jgi:predicted flap endonuclease-1-like 5' DNA nuclease
MFILILQSALLLAIAFTLGCIAGCAGRFYLRKSDTAQATAAVPAHHTSDVTPAAPPPTPAAAEAPPARPKTGKKPAAKRKTAATAANSTKTIEKPKTASGGAKDDLKRIRGIGRQNEARLNALGVTRFEQIAKWRKKDVEEWGVRLAFPGRIEREEWVPQAKLLAKGEVTEFAARVSGGKVASSAGRGSVGTVGKKPRTLKAARKSGADNLTLIGGIGNAIEKRLFALGIFHFDQIAGWSKDEAVWIGNAIGFAGRVERENWVEEARILADGGTTSHAERVESGAIKSSRKSTDAERENLKGKKS